MRQGREGGGVFTRTDGGVELGERGHILITKPHRRNIVLIGSIINQQRADNDSVSCT